MVIRIPNNELYPKSSSANSESLASTRLMEGATVMVGRVGGRGSETLSELRDAFCLSTAVSKASFDGETSRRRCGMRGECRGVIIQL